MEVEKKVFHLGVYSKFATDVFTIVFQLFKEHIYYNKRANDPNFRRHNLLFTNNCSIFTDYTNELCIQMNLCDWKKSKTSVNYFINLLSEAYELFKTFVDENKQIYFLYKSKYYSPNNIEGLFLCPEDKYLCLIDILKNKIKAGKKSQYSNEMINEIVGKPVDPFKVEQRKMVEEEHRNLCQEQKDFERIETATYQNDLRVLNSQLKDHLEVIRGSKSEMINKLYTQYWNINSQLEKLK